MENKIKEIEEKLLRKEQECETLVCQLDFEVQKKECLEQECEELKKQVEIFTRQLEKANKEVIKEKEKNATQQQKNEKLEQTLTEIKEIAEKEVKHAPDGETFSRPEIKQILQKISEVEDEN